MTVHRTCDPNIAKVRKRLLIRPGGIGDCITTFPAMEKLLGDYTEVWTNRSCIPLAHFADDARCAIARGILLIRFPEQWNAVQLRGEFARFDDVISWYGRGCADIEQGFAALHPRVTLLPPLPPYSGTVHAVDFHLSAANLSWTEPAIPHIDRIEWTGENRFIAIQPFASSSHKEWPFDRFVELASLLSDYLPVRWFVESDRSARREIPKGALVNARLDAIARELSQAALFIGNDSGIAHLAGSVGVPAIVLFGASNPSVWAPRSRGPVIVLSSPTGRMDEIDISRVARSALNLLGLAPRVFSYERAAD